MRLISLALALAASAPLPADSFSPSFSGYSITTVFQNKLDSPSLPFIPLSYGGLSARPGQPNQLIVGGTAEGSGAAFYSVGVARDVGGHIARLTGAKSLYATAPKLAGGAAFGPSLNAGEVFFYTIASGSSGVDVGMIRWGHTATDKTVGIVPETPGGLGFVPPGFGGFQQMKVLTGSGKFYSVTYQADPEGTYNLTRAELTATLPVANVQSFVYIKGGTPGFAVDSLLVAEHTAGSIAAYEVDDNGNPRPATRRPFFSGPPFARPEGMMIDPPTGDLLITTYSSSTSGIYRISGFIPPVPIPITGCQSITTPGHYQLTQDIGPAVDAPCLQIRDTANVHLGCAAHLLTGYITVVNTNNFSIRDCLFPSTPIDGILGGNRPSHLTVANSSNGLISRNKFGITQTSLFYVKLQDAQRINIVDNQLYAFLNMERMASTTVRYNRIATPSTFIGGDLVAFNSGASNVADANSISGVNIESEGQTIAILFQDETNGIISHNNAVCGAFCIYLTSVTGANVNANQTRGGSSALEGHNVTDVVWSNNVAEAADLSFYLTGALRNTLKRNRADTSALILSVATPAGQNLIQENVFGHKPWIPGHGNPDFGTLPVPAGAILDGGGNTCLAEPGPYPLVCQ